MKLKKIIKRINSNKMNGLKNFKNKKALKNIQKMIYKDKINKRQENKVMILT